MSEMGGGAETDPACFASDDTFLETLAWCVSVHCKDEVPVYTLEEYWLQNVAGTQSVQPSPKYSYLQALNRISHPPMDAIDSGNPLNKTSTVSDKDYLASFNAQAIFQKMEITHERYG